MRMPRKLKKKLRKQEWKHFLDNSEEIISEILYKIIVEDMRKVKS